VPSLIENTARLAEHIFLSFLLARFNFDLHISVTGYRLPILGDKVSTYEDVSDPCLFR